MAHEKALTQVPEPFELYDLADEDQVLAEMSGRVADKYIYQFHSSDGPVEGLSYAGINWASREYAKKGEVLRIVGKPEILVDPTDPEYIVAVVTAQRFAINHETGREVALDTAVGVKRKWTKMKKRDGTVIPDPFYCEKALSMCQRNAKAALLPTAFVKEMIKLAKDQIAGKTSPPRQASPKPPPQERPAAPRQEAPAPKPKKPAPQAPISKGEATQDHATPTTENRQRYAILMKKLAKQVGLSDEEAKRVAQDLTGFGSSRDMSPSLLEEFTKDILGAVNQENTLTQNQQGHYEISRKQDGKILWPIYKKVEGEPVEVTEGTVDGDEVVL